MSFLTPACFKARTYEERAMHPLVRESLHMSMRKVALAALVVLTIAPAAHAQYFGQNTVQYEKFDFKVLTTEHFDIYYCPEEEAAVQLAARMAERWYARLSKLM